MSWVKNAEFLKRFQPKTFIARRNSNSYRCCMVESEYKQEVCHRLELAIEAIGLKKVDVCRELNVSEPKLNHWCHGRHYPSPFFIYRFCERFGVSAAWIYQGIVAVPMAPALAAALWAGEEASRLAQPAALRQAPKKVSRSKKSLSAKT